MLELSVISL